MGQGIVFHTITQSNVTTNSADGGGGVISGAISINGKGVMWKKNSAPSTLLNADGYTSDGTSLSAWSSHMSELIPNSHYYYTAYVLPTTGGISLAVEMLQFDTIGLPPTPKSMTILGQSITLNGQKITLSS